MIAERTFHPSTECPWDQLLCLESSVKARKNWEEHQKQSGDLAKPLCEEPDLQGWDYLP